MYNVIKKENDKITIIKKGFLHEIYAWNYAYENNLTNFSIISDKEFKNIKLEVKEELN